MRPLVQRSHLRLLPSSPELRFEREVGEVLRQISPEGRPPSPEAQRWSRRLLIAIMLLECVGGLVFGWYAGGLKGSFIGLAAVLVFATLRAGPILIAAAARRRDRQRAEEIVRARWRQSGQIL